MDQLDEIMWDYTAKSGCDAWGNRLALTHGMNHNSIEPVE